MGRPYPIFAVTMGDPAGIGPEIALKAVNALQNVLEYGIIIVGDLSVLERASQFVNLSASGFRSVAAPREALSGAINVLDMHQIAPREFALGTAQPQCGRSSYAYILKAIALALNGDVSGVVTNPINKESLRMAGIDFPGHTEIFAKQTGSRDYSMLFLLDKVGVAHVTTHCSLREALNLISRERVLVTIRLLDTAMRSLGIRSPRIAIGGLNPHAGEHGLFGNEESQIIEPAIESARSEDLDASGPYPPDTVFMRAFKGEFDGVVAMLHDHGFVALKSRDFEHGVNITIGLPIIRTSVGHGTAYDLAGTGRASPASLIAAIETAWKLYKNG